VRTVFPAIAGRREPSINSATIAMTAEEIQQGRNADDMKKSVLLTRIPIGKILDSGRSFRMKHVFDTAVLNEVKGRMTLLKPNSERQWAR